MSIDAILVHGGAGNRRFLHTVLRRAWLRVRAWAVKRRTRHDLVEMTDDQLRDIGVTRSEARREVEKSFYWD